MRPAVAVREHPAIAAEPTFSDRFLPRYDVSDTVAVEVRADASRVWEALMAVDLIELGRRKPLIGVLGGVRALPEVVAHLLHGEHLPGAPERLRLRDMASAELGPGAWVLLGERPADEIALGLIGKFWRPVIEYAQIGADGFAEFSAAGFAKTIYALAVRPLPDGTTLLTGTMRTATTDEAARRSFDRYWTLGVGSGAHVLVRGLLEAARESAESAVS